jgi:ribosomal protein L24E
MPEIIDSGIRKAIKEHLCDYCGGEIKKGEKYNYQNNKYDGRLYTWKSHVKCEKLASHYNMFDDCGDYGLSGDDFQEYIYYKFSDEFSFEEKVNLLYDKINITKE